MNFRPELAEAVMADPPRKTVTRRLVSDNPNSPWWREKCAYRVGQEVDLVLAAAGADRGQRDEMQRLSADAHDPRLAVEDDRRPVAAPAR